QHQPSIVDMKLTINELYVTMVDGDPEEMKDSDRPTLRKYFDSLRDWTNYKAIVPDNINAESGSTGGTLPTSPNTIATPGPSPITNSGTLPGPRVSDFVNDVGNGLLEDTFSADVPGAEIFTDIT